MLLAYKQFQKFFRTMTTRRSLRNTNTCPSSQNPFASLEPQDPVRAYVPESVLRQIPNTSTLSCSQITSLSAVINEQTLEQALRKMKRASEWQNSEVSDLRKDQKANSVERGQKGGEQMVAEGARGAGERGDKHQRLMVGTQTQLMGDYLDEDLRGFLMEPPNPIIDCEYPFNALLIQPESINEPCSMDLQEFDF